MKDTRKKRNDAGAQALVAFLLNELVGDPEKASKTTNVELAERFGVHLEVVRKYRKRFGVTDSPTAGARVHQARLWILDNIVGTPENERPTLEYMAKVCGVSTVTIWRLLREIYPDKKIEQQKARVEAEKAAITHALRQQKITQERETVRAWMTRHLVKGPKTAREYGFTDGNIATLLGVNCKNVIHVRHALGIPRANDRISRAAAARAVPVGGPPRPLEEVMRWTNTCVHFRAYIRPDGERHPTRCLCGLVADHGEIDRRRCHEGCPSFEANKLTEKAIKNGHANRF
jgi:hypothetical protein